MLHKKNFGEKFDLFGVFIIKENNIMKKIVRLTETDLVRLVKRVMNEQWAGDHYRDSTIVSDNGKWYGNLGKSAGLGSGKNRVLSHSCGDKNLPAGNVQVANNIAKSFVNAIKGIDLTGKGQEVILKNLKTMETMSLPDWNQVLVEYCKLPKSWSSKNLFSDLNDEVGWNWAKGNTQDLEYMLDNQAKNKIESYCKNYSSNKTFTDKFN